MLLIRTTAQRCRAALRICRHGEKWNGLCDTPSHSYLSHALRMLTCSAVEKKRWTCHPPRTRATQCLLWLRCLLQPFGEDEDAEGRPDGEERMEVLEQQQPPQPTDRPRTTTRYMTKYERARILGTRALQIRCALPEVHGCWLAVSSSASCVRRMYMMWIGATGHSLFFSVRCRV